MRIFQDLCYLACAHTKPLDVLIVSWRQWCRDSRVGYPNGGGLFLQDLASCHTAKKVKKFLKKNHIKVLDWSGNSPSLNPINNFTAIEDIKSSYITINNTLAWWEIICNFSEVLDFGYPQKTDTAILKTFITQQGMKYQVQSCILFWFCRSDCVNENAVFLLM